MQEEKKLKVFISYSWNRSDFVLKLAKKLQSDGIDTTLDKWDLKPGQDKYIFMEQSVNSPEVNKVLIVCDKTYTEKANNRIGGVGEETTIITSGVYKNVNQEKFIPIVIEKDEDDEAFVPSYLATRIYIDFSNSEKYDTNYEELLRNIYDKPKYVKPPLRMAIL